LFQSELCYLVYTLRIRNPSPVKSTSGSPWHRAGLRWNPFGEPAPEDLAALIVPTEPAAPADWLRQPRAVQQYLGEAGRGKTARLRHLCALIPDAPYVYLAEDEPLPPLPDPAEVPGPLALLLDEAQRLPPRRRRQLFAAVARSGRSLVMASHADLSAEATGAGLTCWTVRIAGLSAGDLLAILRRRIAWARLDDAAPALPQPGDAQELIAEFGDDIRSILDTLYERCQDWVMNGGRHPWRSVT
jgi:hypothetical protein